MSVYKNIKTKDDYTKLLDSGMFWEFHPELSGEWVKDEPIINKSFICLVSESLLSKCWNCQYFEVTGKNYAKMTIGKCHLNGCSVDYPKWQKCGEYKQSDNFR